MSRIQYGILSSVTTFLSAILCLMLRRSDGVSQLHILVFRRYLGIPRVLNLGSIFVGVASLIGSFCPAALGQDIRALTVCEVLDHLSAYNGKTVIVVGRLTSTGEGSWLNEDCEHKLVTNGYTWPSMLWLTSIREDTTSVPALPHAFHWNDMALRKKVDEIAGKAKPRAATDHDRYVAMYGRLETRKKFIIGRTGSGWRGNGYGHLNAAPAQLISPENGIYVLPIRQSPDSRSLSIRPVFFSMTRRELLARTSGASTVHTGQD